MAQPNGLNPDFAAGVGIGAGVRITAGTGAPTGVTATKGSLYVRVDGSTGITRLYVNTDGGTTWTTIAAAA